jgi:hypothetical protein
MGLVRKRKDYEPTVVSKPGRTSSWRSIKRYIAKLAAFFVATIIFGIIYSGTTQPILDMAFRGEIGWGSAISQAMIKALQYGTIRWPEFLINGFDALVQARPFTAFILSVVSLCATGGRIVHKNFSLTVYQLPVPAVSSVHRELLLDQFLDRSPRRP